VNLLNKEETERTIVTAHDPAVGNNSFKNKILKEKSDSKCRLCKEHKEIIDHLASRCPILAKNEYLKRHGRVGAYFHYSPRDGLGKETTAKRYKHRAKPECGHEYVTVLWNEGLHTHKKLQQISWI
jgi:hypothetical protein